MTAAPRVIRVPLAGRAYDVAVGRGLLADAAAWLAPFCKRGRAVIVTDETVQALHGLRLAALLAGAGFLPSTLAVPPGEASKSFAGLQLVCDFLLGQEVERGEAVIALGGGVVGDLAGLAAALVKRGVDYVQVPTTLLAQVDSSVGGKTAINAAAGKNLIGAFHQPRLVLADTATLATLPERDRRAGFAEIVKIALARDGRFFGWLEDAVEALLGGEEEALVEAVARAVALKAEIVAADERETGLRALLNLGHTFGHALEAEGGYEAGPRHGEAVAVGMALAARLAALHGVCGAEVPERLERLLARAQLPARPSALAGPRATAEGLLARMRHDKKADQGRLRLILPRAIGAAEVMVWEDEEGLLGFLRDETG